MLFGLLVRDGGCFCLVRGLKMVMRECDTKRGGLRISLATLFAVTILASPWFAANDCMADLGPLQNGGFLSDLSEWTADGPVDWVAGAAVVGEDDIGWTSFTQTFTIPDNSASLYFEYLPGFEDQGEESFTASLLYPDSGLPLIGSASYYFMHDWDAETSGDAETVDASLYDPTLVTVTDLAGGWKRVNLDLSGLGGATDVLLAFDFVGGGYDGNLFDGNITLDNMTVVPVPVPSAVVLGIAGFSAALCRLRRRL
jgi:hypothetical protein